MKTILYFQSSLNASNNSSLEGVKRFAKSSNWRIHITPYADAAYYHGDHTASSQQPDVKKLLKFWKPVGVIAECGAAPKLLKPRDFGAVPVVLELLQIVENRGRMTSVFYIRSGSLCAG